METTEAFVVEGWSTGVPVCPIHHCEFVQRTAQFGQFWGCPQYPACDLTASKSKFDKRWRMGDQRLRDAKHAAHAAFDLLWGTGRMRRGDAYRWLQTGMGLEADKCHILHFTEAGCAEVVRLATAKLTEMTRENEGKDER